MIGWTCVLMGSDTTSKYMDGTESYIWVPILLSPHVGRVVF